MCDRVINRDSDRESFKLQTPVEPRYDGNMALVDFKDGREAREVHAMLHVRSPMARICVESSKYSCRLPFNRRFFYGELLDNLPELAINWPSQYAKVFSEIESCLHLHGFTTFHGYIEDESLVELMNLVSFKTRILWLTYTSGMNPASCEALVFRAVVLFLSEGDEVWGWESEREEGQKIGVLGDENLLQPLLNFCYSCT
ncbi:hypothetical protein BGX38DRAFT_135246 [Terfezia claveryi]|nr:hypothetical protein BGX38DRAFT_135246 [Terfezia claveryi]